MIITSLATTFVLAFSMRETRQLSVPFSALFLFFLWGLVNGLECDLVFFQCASPRGHSLGERVDNVVGRLVVVMLSAADNDNGYLFLVTILRSNFGLLPYETSLVDGSVEMRSLQGSLRAFLAGGRWTDHKLYSSKS